MISPDLDPPTYNWPAVSSPSQEARHGQRWQQGREGLEAYNRENKVEPMQRALGNL